jgi:hypothetical protein
MPLDRRVLLLERDGDLDFFGVDAAADVQLLPKT